MKVVAIIITGILGLIGHGIISEQTKTEEISLPALRGHVFDPRPYLPAPTTTTTTIEVQALGIPYEDRCPRWHDLAREVGISDAEFPHAMRILYRESRCAASAVNDTKNADGSIDYGLAQINDRTWCLPNKYSRRGFLQERRIISSCDDLLDPATNLRAMVALMEYSRDRTGCPFTPWAYIDCESL